jgi:D-sedoheptulose 7-phosphate isomerase
MKDNYYNKYAKAIDDALSQTVITDSVGKEFSHDEGLANWCDLCNGANEAGGMIYFIGNGASATMASHMALDFTKNGGFKSLAFNDSAYLTAIGNDLSYENVFSFPIEKFGREGDLLISISSSGNSPNILKGISAAQKQKMKVVTLSGMKPDNQSRCNGDLNVYVPAKTYGIVECTHQVLLHCWLDCLMNLKEGE